VLKNTEALSFFSPVVLQKTLPGKILEMKQKLPKKWKDIRKIVKLPKREQSDSSS
jgi:hypothetical protein